MSVQFVQQRLSLDILRGDMGECDAMHTTLLDQFALFVLHHIDETVRFEFFDEKFDEVRFARTASAVDVTSAILYDRIGNLFLKGVMWTSADFLGFVYTFPPAIVLKRGVC